MIFVIEREGSRRFGKSRERGKRVDRNGERFGRCIFDRVLVERGTGRVLEGYETLLLPGYELTENGISLESGEKGRGERLTPRRAGSFE